jgi:hypothetical protein
MVLSSTAYAEAGVIPEIYARPGAGGQNVSVPFQWSGAPEGTRSFALVIVDTHPIADSWVHWMIIDLPATASALPEGISGGALPTGARELTNSFGASGYGGPQPPAGSGEHVYEATLYALDTPQLELADGAGLEGFREAVSGHVLAQAALSGTYGMDP